MSTTAQPSRRPIYLILFAALAAAAGNGISLIAFPWLVLQHNGSAFDASIVAGAASLPLLFSTLIAGTAVDYLGRRRVSIISDALSATTVAAVPVLAIMFGHASITVGVLAVLAALGAVRSGRHHRTGIDVARGRHERPWHMPPAHWVSCWPAR
jgi:MFS family permease